MIVKVAQTTNRFLKFGGKSIQITTKKKQANKHTESSGDEDNIDDTTTVETTPWEIGWTVTAMKKNSTCDVNLGFNVEPGEHVATLSKGKHKHKKEKIIKGPRI